MLGVLNVEADMETSMVTVRGIVDAPKLIEYIRKHLGKHAEFVKEEEEVRPCKDNAKDKNKDKCKDDNKSKLKNKICSEVVEIRFQYPPQCSVDHIYPSNV